MQMWETNGFSSGTLSQLVAPIETLVKRNTFGLTLYTAQSHHVGQPNVLDPVDSTKAEATYATAVEYPSAYAPAGKGSGCGGTS